jgi:hypothetical protein
MMFIFAMRSLRMRLLPVFSDASQYPTQQFFPCFLLLHTTSVRPGACCITAGLPAHAGNRRRASSMYVRGCSTQPNRHLAVS